MSQFLDTVTEALREQGLFVVRSGKGRASQFWSTNYADPLTIRVQEAQPAQPATATKDGSRRP